MQGREEMKDDCLVIILGPFMMIGAIFFGIMLAIDLFAWWLAKKLEPTPNKVWDEIEELYPPGDARKLID